LGGGPKFAGLSLRIYPMNFFFPTREILA